MRLEIRFRGRLSLPVRVDVATMVDAQLAKPSAWRPDQNSAQAEIENTRIIRHIQVGMGITPQTHTLHHIAAVCSVQAEGEWVQRQNSRGRSEWMQRKQTGAAADNISFILQQVPAPGELELDSSVERTHAATFDFADLRFIKSSRMSKRWLVFTLRIKVRIDATLTNFAVYLLKHSLPEGLCWT